MTAFDLGLSGASPSVRKPVVDVAFGSGSDGLGRSLVALTLQIGLAPAVDAVELLVASGEDAPDVAVGDSGSVSLGYEDGSAELVFTGQVDGVRRNVGGTMRITAANGGALLARLRVDQSYEQQAAGDIVQDLAGRAGVGTDTVESGVSFAFYAVDGGRSAYQHVAELSKKSGYLARFTVEGELSFGPFTGGQPVATFAYGQDIVTLEMTDAALVVGAVKTVGEGAAGSQGQEAWSWLVKDPSSVTGSAGEDQPERLRRDGSLRSSEAAQGAADGWAGAAGLMKLTGRLLVPGTPAVVVGSAIEITDAPQEMLNGMCMVRRVRHRLSKREGFTTLIEFSKTGGSGLGGLG